MLIKQTTFCKLRSLVLLFPLVVTLGANMQQFMPSSPLVETFHWRGWMTYLHSISTKETFLLESYLLNSYLIRKVRSRKQGQRGNSPLSPTVPMCLHLPATYESQWITLRHIFGGYMKTLLPEVAIRNSLRFQEPSLEGSLSRKKTHVLGGRSNSGTHLPTPQS